MVRMYFVQQWFNLADEACEEAVLEQGALPRTGEEREPQLRDARLGQPVPGAPEIGGVMIIGHPMDAR